MENITFCIPYYGKTTAHTDLLSTCIKKIREFYPTNDIIVCKTLTSYLPIMFHFTNVRVCNTYVDGSHIIGAVECLIRECKTSHYVICHDSMFLLKPLPQSILDEKIISLWHFDIAKYDYYDTLVYFMSNDYSKENTDSPRLLKAIYDDSNRWHGVFGPAFAGQFNTLKLFWSNLNIHEGNIHNYLNRMGIMYCERYFSIIFSYMGVDTTKSLNGNITLHPNVFKENTVPEFKDVTYHSYFYKVWQGR